MLKNKGGKIKLIYTILFLVFGIVLLLFIQKILCPKYMISNVDEEMGGKVKEIYNTRSDTYDVVFIGTSHVVCGISPIEIYQQNHIKSYNFAISGQPIALSYCILQDLIKNKNPKLVVYDASGLFIDGAKSGPWRYVIDNLPYGKSKYVMVNEYKKYVGQDAFRGAMFPIVDYHTRWKQLTSTDFVLSGTEQKNNFLNGYEIRSGTVSAAVTVEDMNRINSEIQNRIGERTKFGYDIESIENIISMDCIDEENSETLRKMKQLCDKQGVEFLLIKIPAVSDPTGYRTWTLDRYYQTKELCEKLNIEYWDLMYESDFDIDWTQDSHDGGFHLNICGAEKVSKNVAKRLEEQYILNQDISPTFDQNMFTYEKLKYIALLECQNSIMEYLQQIESKQQDLILMLAVNNNCFNCVTELEQQKLTEMGFKTEINDLYQKSYLAIMDGETLCYEVFSDAEEAYWYQTANHNMELVSSGYLSSSKSSIKINGNEYALNWPGVNIVVFDKSIEMVVDSITINEGVIYRDGNKNSALLKMCRLYYMSL